MDYFKVTDGKQVQYHVICENKGISLITVNDEPFQINLSSETYEEYKELEKKQVNRKVKFEVERIAKADFHDVLGLAELRLTNLRIFFFEELPF